MVQPEDVTIPQVKQDRIIFPFSRPAEAPAHLPEQLSIRSQGRRADAAFDDWQIDPLTDRLVSASRHQHRSAQQPFGRFDQLRRTVVAAQHQTAVEGGASGARADDASVFASMRQRDDALTLARFIHHHRHQQIVPRGVVRRFVQKPTEVRNALFSFALGDIPVSPEVGRDDSDFDVVNDVLIDQLRLADVVRDAAEGVIDQKLFPILPRFIC